MGFGDFWLQSNNGKKYNLKDLKDIGIDGLAKNPKLQKFINLFDLDRNGTINGQKEWQSVFADLQQAAVDNELTSEEFGLYISKKLPNEDLKLEDVNELLDAATINSEADESEVIEQTVTEDEFIKIATEAFNTILTSTYETMKTEKDYEDLYAFAKDKLSEVGKSPTLKEIILYASELQMLNPDIKQEIKAETSINVPSKSIDKNDLQILETKGIKIEKENYIFFQKLLELDDKKQASVLDIISNSDFETKEELINEVYNKTKINLADTGLTIRVRGVSSTLEHFITKTLNLDLTSEEGLKIYERLSCLDQTALDSFPKEFIDKLLKTSNITFDKLADKAEAFGIILRTDEEIEEREKNNKEYRDLRSRIFMANYVADSYTSSVTTSQNADRELNFTQGGWWVRNSRPIGETASEGQKRETEKVAQIKKLVQDADVLTNEEFAKRMSTIMEAKRSVTSAVHTGDLPRIYETKDPSFEFNAELTYTFMQQMQTAELAAFIAKRLEPKRKQNREDNPYSLPSDNTRVYNARRKLMEVEHSVEPLNKNEIELLKQYTESIKTKKELFLFAKSLHYNTNSVNQELETMIPQEYQSEIAKLIYDKAKELDYSETKIPGIISLNTFKDVFSNPVNKTLQYPETKDKTIMETFDDTKTKLMGNWDPVGDQIRQQEMEGALGGVLDIATMILVTKGLGSTGAFIKIGNVGKNVGTATNFIGTANIAGKFSKNAKLINKLSKADKVLGSLWVNGMSGALHGSATMGAYGALQGGASIVNNIVENIKEGNTWSDGLGERFGQTLLMGYENAKFGFFAGYSGVLAQAIGKGTAAVGSKGIDKLFKTNYSKSVVEKVSNIVTEEGISGSEFWTKMNAATKAEGIVGFGAETGFFTLYHKLEEAGVDFEDEESLLSAIEANMDDDTKKSLGSTYLSEGKNLAMFKIIGSLIQWVHIGKISAAGAMEVQARNNRALKNINMKKVTENGKESYIVKFNENENPVRCDAENLMQLCEHKMFCADIEDKIQKDGKYELPDKQTIEFDRANNVYKILIDSKIPVEAANVEELLAQANRIAFKNKMDEQLSKENKVELNEDMILTKTDGKYQIEITLEDGSIAPVQSEDLNDVMMRAQFVKSVLNTEAANNGNKADLVQEGVNREVNNRANTEVKTVVKEGGAIESDLSVVHRMDVENFEGRGYNISENFAEYKADLENHGIETHVLKSQEGQVIGYYQLEPINGDELYIYSIGVPKELQNTRSSYSALKTMQEEIANLAREKGLSKVTLDVESNNPKLVKLYKKFGFEEKGNNADGDIHMEADVKKVLGIEEVSEITNTESVTTNTDLRETKVAETKAEEKITPPQNTLVSSIMSKNTKVYTKDEILRVLKNYKVTDEKIIAELLELPYVQEMAKIYDFYYETNGGYKGKENDFGYIDAMKGYAKNNHNIMFKTTEFLTKENYDRIKEMADETVDNIHDILYYANEFTISNAEFLMKKFGRKLSEEDFEFIRYCTNRDGSLSEKAFEFYEKAYHSTRLLWYCRDNEGYFAEDIFDFGVKLINQLDSQETIRVGYNNRTLTRLKSEDDVSYIVGNCKNKDGVLNPDAVSIALEYCTKDTDSSTLSNALKLKNDDGSFNIECFKKLMELNKKFGMTYSKNYILSSVEDGFYRLDAKNIDLVYRIVSELGYDGVKQLENAIMDRYDRGLNTKLRDLALELIDLPKFPIKDVNKVLLGCKGSKYAPDIEYIKNLYLDLIKDKKNSIESIISVLPYTHDFNRDFVTKLVKEIELTPYALEHLVKKTTINNTDFAEKLYFNKDFKFKSHIASLLEYVHQGNKDLAEKLCLSGNYGDVGNGAYIADIIRYANSKTSKLAEKLYFSDDFPQKELIASIISPAEHCVELADRLCFSKDFSQKELIAEILRYGHYQSKFTERLCFDKDFPKELITSVLQVTGNDVLEVAETLCFSKDFREKEYISEILKEIDEQNKSLALKLCFNKDFPKKLISSILSVTGGKNINIAEKLCFSDFPKEYLKDIIDATTDEKSDFAEKLCFSNFPKEYISKIVKNVNPDTIELADFLCFESPFPKENIHQVLQYASNVTIDYAKKMCTEMKLPVEEIINRVKAGYRSEKHVEEHHELLGDAILHRDLLKTGLEDLSDKDIESTMNSSNTTSTLFVLGKGNLEAAFPMTIDGFKDVCSEIRHMRISEDNLELLLRKINPVESKKYNEFMSIITPLKQKLREIIGEEKAKQIDEIQAQRNQVDIQIKTKIEQLRSIDNYVELSNSIKQLQTQLKQTKDETKKPKIEEELKQKIAECNEILSRHPEIINLQNEIKELQKQSKILNGQAQSLYFSCDNVQEVKTLMGQINAKTKELNAFLKEFVDINPQQVIDKVRVLAAISSISTEEEMTQFINLIQPSSVESNKTWDEAVNKKIYQKIGIECDENLAKKLDLIHCKYLSKMMASSDGFFKYMKVLVQIVKDNPDKSVQEIFDSMPQNIQTKQMLEQIGIDYEKWTKVDKNSYSTVRVKLDADAARKKAINSLEEDLNDSLFGKLPENIHKEIIEDLKEIGVTFEKQRIDNFVGDGISRGQTDYYRLYKNGKPIEFGDLKSILSSIKKTINKNEFWSTTQSEQDVESARGTLYEHLTKLRAEDIEQALSMKDGEEVEIEIHKTDMYDVKKALGLGNDGQCCTALGKKFNEYSAPTYIMNKCIGAIELVDKGNFVGNTMIYIAYVDGKPALVLDNIELKTKYHNNDAIRDTFLEYAKKLCTEIGQPDLPIYAGPNRHKLEMSVYPKTKHKMQVVGNTGNQPIYIDYDASRHTVNGTETAEIEMYKLR